MHSHRHYCYHYLTFTGVTYSCMPSVCFTVCVCACVGHSGERRKTAEPIEMPFRRQTYVVPRKGVLDVDVHWRHLANTIEQFVHASMQPYVALTMA